MASISGSDNRRFQRAIFKRPVKCKTSEVEIFAGHLAQDISQGGMRVHANAFVPVNARVVLQVQLDPQAKLLEMEAKVVWVKEMSYGNGFQLGLEFTTDTSFEQAKIARFVVKS